MPHENRLSALEERVATIEAQLQDRAGADGPAGSATPAEAPADVFWALEGLQARVDEPGAVLLTGQVQLPDGREAQWQEAAGTEQLLGADWAELTESLAALGHPVRLRLLQQVLSGVATVQALLATDGMGTSGQVYHHLRQLTAAGWLRALGGGRYEVPVARVVPLLATALGARR